MKQSVKKLLAIVLISLYTTTLFAYDFEVDGICYMSIDDSSCMVIPKGNEYSGDIVIPTSVTYKGSKYSVTKIREYAFNMCIELTSVNIPNSVTEIGNRAFEGCENLKTIILSNNIISIPEKMCSGCFNLSSVEIPHSVLSIGDNAFSQTNLTSIIIPPNVKAIGSEAFSSCVKLTSIVLSESLKEIGTGAFWDCRRMEKVYISDLDAYLQIDFADDGARPLRYSSKGGYLYVNGEKLTDIAISEGTNVIEKFSFSNCNLESATIPEGVTIIEDYAFSGCRLGKTMLELPSTVEKIGDYVFDSITFPVCKINAETPPEITPTSFGPGLSVLIVPNGCMRTYKAAYEGITGLTIVEEKEAEVYVSQESNLLDELIAIRATPNLITDLTIHGTLAEEDLAWINSNMTSLLHLDISDTDCESIPNQAFMNNETLMNIKLPNSLKSIGNDAFQNCLTLCGSIVFPKTLETIGDYAFSECRNITDITFNDNLQKIGRSAFSGCGGLKAALLPESLTEIGSDAFNGCSSMTSISLPQELTALNAYCFNNCGFEQIEFPASLVTIGWSALFGTKLKTIDLSKCTNLKEIGDEAFKNCDRVETLNLPSSLERIGTDAFSGCKNLKHISSPCVLPPTIEANADPFNGVDNMECLLSIPTSSFRDYFMSKYWAGFMAFEQKAEIQIVTDNNSNNNDFTIRYRKGNPQSLLKMNSNMNAIEDESFVAVTSAGSSVFSTDAETVDFEILPTDGLEILQVFYGDEDVTSQLVDNVYTTPASTAADVKVLKIKMSTTSSVDDIAEDNAIKVYGMNGNIMISGNSDLVATEVYSVSGQLVYKGTDTTISVPAKGIYIVRVAGQTFKVAL